MPYVYLTALSLAQDLTSLRKAQALRAPFSKWFAYLAEVLVLETKPVQTIALKGKVEVPTLSTSTRAGTIKATLGQ
jgi:hypothetical protein